MASAGQLAYASLHLAPDRWPCQHLTTQLYSNCFKRHLRHIIFPVPSLRPAPCHLPPYWLPVPQVRPTGWDVCNRNVSRTIEDIFQRSVVDLLARQHSLLFDHPLTFTVSSQHLHSHSRTSTSSPTLYCTAHWNYENCLWQVSPAEDRTFTACILLLLLLHPFNGLFSRTTWVSQYQKGKNHFGFKGGKRRCGFGMQWHQLDHMQTICTLLQTTPTRHHSQFLQTRCSSWCPTNSVKALKAYITRTTYWKVKKEFIILIHFYSVSFSYKPAIQRSVMYSVTDNVSLLY